MDDNRWKGIGKLLYKGYGNILWLSFALTYSTPPSTIR